jgi:hypothetical protein
MKYPIETYNKLVEGLKILLKHYNIDPTQKVSGSDLNYLHYKIYQQYNYVNHPNLIYVDGKRLLPIDTDFKLYPDGCNDNHVDTAMRAAFKELSGNPVNLVDKAQLTKILEK